MTKDIKKKVLEEEKSIIDKAMKQYFEERRKHITKDSMPNLYFLGKIIFRASLDLTSKLVREECEKDKYGRCERHIGMGKQCEKKAEIQLCVEHLELAEKEAVEQERQKCEKEELNKIKMRMQEAVNAMIKGECSQCNRTKEMFKDTIRIDKCSYHQGIEDGVKQERQKCEKETGDLQSELRGTKELVEDLIKENKEIRQSLSEKIDNKIKILERDRKMLPDDRSFYGEEPIDVALHMLKELKSSIGTEKEVNHTSCGDKKAGNISPVGYSQSEIPILDKINKAIDELKMENPYPADIFTGITEEGKIGQYGKQVWNNCCEELKQKLKSSIGTETKKGDKKNV